jgi:drug/metabolite transporter (DMT)-like permease
MAYLEPHHFGAFYFALLGLSTLVLFGLPKPRRLLRALGASPSGELTRGRFAAALAVVGLNAVMVYTHFLALQRVEVAYMISVKRVSLLFGILYGALIFRESGLRTHLPAGAMMLAGVVLMTLS